MKNYLSCENKFKTLNKGVDIKTRSIFGFEIYWSNLGYNPNYAWKMLHKKIR